MYGEGINKRVGMSDKKPKKLFRNISEKVQKIKEDLKSESVGQNPEKPVDCCNPPDKFRYKTEQEEKPGSS
jgi:hypothetical protein